MHISAYGKSSTVFKFLHHLVYKVTAGLNRFAFFVFRESHIFVTPMVAAGWFAGGCSTACWWMMAAHWLKNGVITYLSHGQSKQGV